MNQRDVCGREVERLEVAGLDGSCGNNKATIALEFQRHNG